MTRLVIITSLALSALTACGAEEGADFELEAGESALSTRYAFKPINRFQYELLVSMHKLVGTAVVIHAEGDDTGGDGGSGGEGEGGSGGSGEGGSSGGGTECSDEAEGDQCTECTVNGLSCECCGWTECWEEDGICVCALTVEDVNCEEAGGSGGFQIGTVLSP